MAGIDYGAVVFKNKIRYKSNELYPYIEEIDIMFYKCGMVYNNDEGYIWFDEGKFHWNFELNNVCYNVKRIAESNVFKASIFDKTTKDKYIVIFGYGIDNSTRVWRECKEVYLGKKVAKKVDRILSELGFYSIYSELF